MPNTFPITPAQIANYERDGAVLIKGLFAGFVETIQEGIARNMREPGPYASENLKAGEGGRFLTTIAIGRAFPNLKMSSAIRLQPPLRRR
jgi:hypothetical protein